MQNSLLIVGAGRLGSEVGKLWTGPVTAETKTTKSHASLQAMGFTARIASDVGSFENVVFCIPPSAAEGTYTHEVKRALSLWDRKGVFLMVSSTGVYAAENGETIREDSAEGSSPRAQTLLDAERAVLSQGGKCVRLAGLYDQNSGPHLLYARQSTSPLFGESWINLIHREDAASLCLRILEFRGDASVFLGCDEKPVTRNEIAALIAKHFKKGPCKFLANEGALGKKCDGSYTQKVLNWKPKWKSLEAFLATASQA